MTHEDSGCPEGGDTMLDGDGKLYEVGPVTVTYPSGKSIPTSIELSSKVGAELVNILLENAPSDVVPSSRWDELCGYVEALAVLAEEANTGDYSLNLNRYNLTDRMASAVRVMERYVLGAGA